MVELEADTSLIFGEGGVWLQSGGGAVEDYNAGLPENPYRRDVRALALAGGDTGGIVYAATRGGLFMRALGSEAGWRKIELPGVYDGVVDVLATGEALYALTRSDIYRMTISAGESGHPGGFISVTPSREADPDRPQSLFRLIFDMHSGETWGTPGRLLMDVGGLYLAFASVTGGWFWWWRKRKTLGRGRWGKAAAKGLKLHIKAGLWLSPLMLLLALTGIFQRPPLLIAIADATYQRSHHPGPLEPNPWHDMLRKITRDPDRGTIVLSTTEGFFEVREAALGTDGAVLSPVKERGPRPPVSVMGATVFEWEDGRYVTGSMSGVFTWERPVRRVLDAITGERPQKPTGPPVGEHRVVGYARRGGTFWWADYDRGLFTREGERVELPMPEALSRNGRISLWHALFELHNGRMFTFLLGWWAWVVVPLGGLCMLLETVTGVFDRLAARKTRR